MYTYYNPQKSISELMRATEARVASKSFPINVIAQDDAYEIQAFLPNLTAEDIEIEILENRINIRGEYPKVEEEITYLLNEQPYGKFSRTLRMPKDLDANLAEAKVENGMLILKVPQAEYAKSKLIEIKAK